MQGYASLTEPAWKEFETLAYDIQREFAGDALVTLRDTIKGVDSGTPRQIDISIRQQVGPHSILVVVDCKDHQEPLDVNVVGQFVTVVRDVRANKGALIASRGFTTAAIELARAHGIDTFTLVDTAGANWRAYVSIPALLHGTNLASASFRFVGTAPGGTLFPAGDPTFWEIHAPDGMKLGTVRDLLAKKWNSGKIPRQPGRQEVVLVDGAKIGGMPDGLPVRVSAVVDIAEVYHFGQWPIQTRGFQDAQTEGLITRQITTEMLSPFEIEQGRVEGWRKVDDPAELAVRPVVRIDYSNVLPVGTQLEGSG